MPARVRLDADAARQPRHPGGRRAPAGQRRQCGYGSQQYVWEILVRGTTERQRVRKWHRGEAIRRYGDRRAFWSFFGFEIQERSDIRGSRQLKDNHRS